MTQKSCRDLLAGLSDYLDEQASEEVCMEIESHLSSCEECRVVVDTIKKTISLYRQLPGPALTDSARQRLYRALDLDNWYRPKADEAKA